MAKVSGKVSRSCLVVIKVAVCNSKRLLLATVGSRFSLLGLMVDVERSTKCI